MADYYVTTSGSDANAGTSEGAAFASLGKAAATARTLGDNIWVKSGTYTLTSSTSNANAGPASIADGVVVEGYQTTTGDRAALPVISAGAITSIDIITMEGSSFKKAANQVFNIEADGNSKAGVGGFKAAVSYNSYIFGCIARNCVDGFDTDGNKRIEGCSAISCSGYGFTGPATSFCLADLCNVGFYQGRSHNYDIASNSTSHGFQAGTGFPLSWSNCTSYNNGGNGFLVSYDINHIVGCIAVSNTSEGYKFGDGDSSVMMLHCADYNNSSRNFHSSQSDYEPIVLTGDPFTDAAGGDFTLNDTAGAGAACKGITRQLLSGTQSVFDIGASHAADSGGGSTVIVIEDD